MTEEIIERLRSLDLSGGSHSRLSAIASCFLEPAFGWTRGACEILRDLLIEIMEDKDGNDDNDNSDGCNRNHHCCDQRQMSYDVLGNERHKAVCKLRKVPDDIGKSELTYQEAEDMIYAALGVEKELIGYYKGLDALRDRLIHLLGCDECNFSGVESYTDAMGGKSNPAETSDESTDHVSLATSSSEDETLVKSTQGKVKFPPNEDGSLDSLKTVEEAEALIEDVKRRADQSHDSSPMRQENETRITDELREFATDPLLGYASQELHVERITAIADRIDEQFDRSCEQQEKVLQDTIDEMTELREHDAEYALAERDVLQEKCDRLKAKVEHQREQLAVYATTYDFDAIRALKRDRNEHKHRADNAVGHVKSLERRLDAAHETYCALLNDAAREFRALTEERDERYQLLPKDSEGEYVHIGDVMEDMFGDTCRVIAVADTWFIQSGESVCYKTARKFRHHRRQPVTVEQVIRDLTLGKITESQAVERIEVIHG